MQKEGPVVCKVEKGVILVYVIFKQPTVLGLLYVPDRSYTEVTTILNDRWMSNLG
jgi:hypothetical protein